MSNETVYLATTSVSGNRKHYHTDRDCSRLKYLESESITSKPLEVVESHKKPCKECGEGYERHHPDGYTRELVDRLSDPDFGPEDAGLSPRGEVR